MIKLPERTVQHIIWLDWSHGSHAHQYCIDCDIETWDSFSLTGGMSEYIRCKVSSLSDNIGNILAIIGKDFDFKTYYYVSTANIRCSRLILPKNLVQQYGMKEDQLIDLLLLEVIRPTGETVEIYPKRLSIGKMEGHPKSGETAPPLYEKLIETEFTDKFYSDLVMEINKAYAFGLYCATLVLVRKLFENLLIDLLRARYGMRRLELFFWKEKGIHHNLSVLINNLQESIPDFKPYTQAFDDVFFKFMNILRERGGASAHSLHILDTSDFLDSNKTSMNKYSELILSVIRRIQKKPL